MEVPAEVSEELPEEIAEEIVEEIGEPAPEIEADIDVNVIEVPEDIIPETSYVDVGDLHISGPPEMVERVTKDYLKNHIDHNPHGENHDETPAEIVTESGETLATAVTPDVVEEQIAESVSDETHDAPPGPSSWLYRPLFGRR